MSAEHDIATSSGHRGADGPAGCDAAPWDWTSASPCSRGPAVAQDPATGPWPTWAIPQLRHAVELAGRTAARGERVALAPELYRIWFNPIVGRAIELGRPWVPLAGLYRGAHAGSSSRVLLDGVATVDRHDVIGRDGWWRTWGDVWRPAKSRHESVRIVMTPRPDALAEFVAAITAALFDEPVPWLLACATDIRRLRRSGGAVLHLPDSSALTAEMIRAAAPHVRSVTPPLCLPVAPGMGLADNPDNGMSFGEHRCHLIALALRNCGGRQAPLRAIADVFQSHGIDPARPYLSRPDLRRPPASRHRRAVAGQ
jgi:hypothetical protein